MNLVLHQWYTAEDAVTIFGGDAASERYCAGQFIILPEVILCLVTLAEMAEGTALSSPSYLIWKPDRLDYEPSDPYSWLPEKVREVYDRSQGQVRKLRNHHIFLRTSSDQRFCYAGQAHLGSYGRNGAVLSASFSLSERLPRDLWLKFGGYPGWLVEVNHMSQHVAAGDLEHFDRLANDLPLHAFSHLCMMRYEEDSLAVYTNSQRGWLMYLRYPTDSGVYVRDLEYKGDPEAIALFECSCGIDLELLANQTVPRGQALQAAIEFFQTGQLPTCVHWEQE